MENKPIAFIRELMLGKSEKQVLEAEGNFREYLLVVKEIVVRIENAQNPQIDEDFV